MGVFLRALARALRGDGKSGVASLCLSLPVAGISGTKEASRILQALKSRM
jgi:hypothetical protein